MGTSLLPSTLFPSICFHKFSVFSSENNDYWKYMYFPPVIFWIKWSAYFVVRKGWRKSLNDWILMNGKNPSFWTTTCSIVSRSFLRKEHLLTFPPVGFSYVRFFYSAIIDFLSISANSHLPVSCTFHRNFQLFQLRTRCTSREKCLVKKCNDRKLLRIVRSIYPALRRIRRRCDDDVLFDFVRKITLFGQLCDGRLRPVAATTFFGAQKYIAQW